MDYKTLCIKQYGYYSKDMYPNILGSKREMSDEPNVNPDAEDDQQERIVEVSKEPHDRPMTLPDLAAYYQDGLATIRTVLESLPASQARNNAIVFQDTATLWVQQAFQEQEARLAAIKRRTR